MKHIKDEETKGPEEEDLEEKASDDALFESGAVKYAEKSISNNDEISFEKIQELNTDNEESKHNLSTTTPEQLEASKGFCNKLGIPKDALALMADE